jgi:carboxyl-terminal processing protease
MLDLRNNGGGALTEAINLVGLFIDRGPVVQVKEPRRGVDHYDVDEAGNGFVYRGPLVVLVSKLSASASEIFAGAIQDYDRGLVVGDQSTHGKGTVQTVLDVGRQLHKNPQLGALKLTIQQFYRVNGDSTQNRGVLSDVVLPSIWDHMEVGESHLPNALPFEKVDPVPYRNLGWANADLKKELQELSDKRRASDSEFRKLDADIERIEVRKQRKSITLNEDKLRLEMSRNDKADENNPDFDQPKKANGPVFERTFYYNECLAVTEDFLRLGAGSHVVSKF